MPEKQNEKQFFFENDYEVNHLVFKIGWIFMAVLFGILAASYYNIFKVAIGDVFFIIGMLAITQTVLFILLKLKANVGFVKYYGLIAIELCIVMMISNAYFGIYISYMLVPAISCLYFDRRLTEHTTVLCYLGMMIGLWTRAPGAITLAYPGYSVKSWFIAFGLGYSLEYAAFAAVLVAVAKRSRLYMKELYHRREKISEIQNKIIYSFADLVESRDDSTGKHVKRTSKYVVMLARKMMEDGAYMGVFKENDLIKLELAAPLHDIGKIVIPDSVLLKPGKLTDEEFEKIKTHTTEGQKIIASAMDGIEQDDFLSVAGDIALSHHEKWDGSGYPNGTYGINISLPARIMAVADVFDALVSERCYKKAVSIEEAFSIIKEGSGTHFDPYIVKVFISCADEIRKIMEDA